MNVFRSKFHIPSGDTFTEMPAKFPINDKTILRPMSLLPQCDETSFHSVTRGPGGSLNIKMSSYQYSDPHVAVDSASTVLCLRWESYTLERRSLYWDGALGVSKTPVLS